MMFLSNVCYHTYSVVVTYARGSEEIWREYWQLKRPRWTARETKMVWNELHDSIMIGACNWVTARVYECELEYLAADSSSYFLMRFSSVADYSRYPELPIIDRVNSARVREWYLAR